MLNENFMLGLVSPVLQIMIAGLLIHRKVAWRFRFFLVYTLYSIVISGVRLWSMGSDRLFFKLYWTSEILYGVLALAVVVPLSRRAFRFFNWKYKRFSFLLTSAVALVVTGSVWWALYHPMGHTSLFRLETSTVAFLMAVRLFEIGMYALCLTIKLDRDNPIDWRPYEFGILTGFGLSAFISLLAYLAPLIFGMRFEQDFRYAPIAAYGVASSYWLKVFFEKEPPPPKPDLADLRRRLELIERQTEIVRKFGQWKGPHRFAGLASSEITR